MLCLPSHRRDCACRRPSFEPPSYRTSWDKGECAHSMKRGTSPWYPLLKVPNRTPRQSEKQSSSRPVPRSPGGCPHGALSGSAASGSGAATRWCARPSRGAVPAFQDSMPRRAIRGLIPRRRQAAQVFDEPKPLSAYSLAGVLRGRPTGRAMGCTASSSGSKHRMSETLAAVSPTASGMPWPSVMIRCLLRGRPRSQGLGPVQSPPFWRVPARYPPGPALSRCGCADLTADACAPGSTAKAPPATSRAAVASTSCPSRSPARAARTPKECPW